MKYLRVRNWEKWQEYRSDRMLPWIKCYTSLLLDDNYLKLSDSEKGHLIGIWLLANSKKGRISADKATIKRLINADTEPDLEKLIELQFLEREPKKRRSSPRPSKQTSAQTRAPSGDQGDRKKKNTDLTPERTRVARTVPTPLEGSALEAQPSAARPGGNGATTAEKRAAKQELYRSQLTELGIAFEADDSVETLAAKLAEHLRMTT